ncbi:GntR family transcriptional regulator [Bacillus daqingensis]|uniref:GntR family transcriptional regulator n=1 Tax=Bacillus daqingensis TaxID=872396 RepID=A0ABV9P103_9BACI
MFYRIDTKSPTPLYEQLIFQIKDLYIQGILAPGEKLPSIRELSSIILVNPNTVSKAYQELERQGIIYTERGRGTFLTENRALLQQAPERMEIKKQLKELVHRSRSCGIAKSELLHWVETASEEVES